MDCIIKIEGAKKSAGREIRGYHGNTHRPWNDQNRPLKDLLGKGMSSYATPIIEHLKTCDACSPGDVVRKLGDDRIATNSRSERIIKALFDHPRVDRKTAINSLVKLSGFNSLFWLATKLSKDELFGAIRMAYLKQALYAAQWDRAPEFKTVIPRSETVGWEARHPKAEDALRGPHRFGPERSKYTKMPAENRELLTRAAILINAGVSFPNTMDELERSATVHEIQTS